MILKLRKVIIIAVSTFFCVGFLPLIPGTFGSLAGILVFYLIKESLFIYLSATCVLIFLGFLVAGVAEKEFNRKDSRYIVIDEVSGMLLSLMFIPYDIKFIFIAFLIFRVFDTLKPFPAGRFQNLKGSLGVMSDDIIAGIYTNILLQIIWRLASLRAS